MELYGITAQDFGIETESWQRSAYEWLSIGVQVVGSVALVAAFVFPPSGVVAGVLVVSGVGGGVLAAINIAERIHTNQFEWDTETWTDIANIATAIVGAGALRVGTVARGILAAEGEAISIGAATRLAGLVRFQRGLLFMGLGTDAARGVLIAIETYNELRQVEAAFPPELEAQYERLWPGEGRQRLEQERVTRIMGILARAATNGLLTLVSVTGQLRALGELGPARPGAGVDEPDLPAVRATAEPTTAEAATLRGTQRRQGPDMTPHEIDVELNLVGRSPRRPSTLEGYIDEVQLGNGHIWRRRLDGRWCRFSNGGFCPTVSRTAMGAPPQLRRLAEAAGVREELDEGRIAVVLHGTTAEEAARIVQNPRDALTAAGGGHGGRLFTATRLDVIDEFAARAVSRRGGQTGVVGIAMSEEVAARLQNLRVRGRDGRLVPGMRTEPIPDRPGMYETIFEPAAVDILVQEGFFFVVTD
jgi:hypothetical protein